MASKKRVKVKDLFDGLPTRVWLDARCRPSYTKPTKKFIADYTKKWGLPPAPQMFFPIIIGWSEKGRGFGEYVFFQKDGKIFCDNECDSRETVKRILCHMVDQAVFKDERPKVAKA